MQIRIVLSSVAGETYEIYVSPNDTVRQLRLKAEGAVGRPLRALIGEDGSVMSPYLAVIEQFGIADGSRICIISGTQATICSTLRAFAAAHGDGSVNTWGADLLAGGYAAVK